MCFLRISHISNFLEISPCFTFKATFWQDDFPQSYHLHDRTLVFSWVLLKYFKLPSGKLTWQWKFPFSNRKLICKWWIFHGYVRLPEGTHSFPSSCWRHRNLWKFSAQLRCVLGSVIFIKQVILPSRLATGGGKHVKDCIFTPNAQIVWIIYLHATPQNKPQM